MIRTFLLAAYGVVCYSASIVSFIVMFSWLGGFSLVPLRLDEETSSSSFGIALAWNSVTMTAFALYHSVFARTRIKKRTRPFLARNLERATYNLLSAILAVFLCILWRPIAIPVWELPSPVTVQVVYVLLWVVHMVSIVLMNHNEFFGLRQIRLAMLGEGYGPLPPVSRRYYLATRLALVISLAMIPWASPVMTAGRLQFCLFMTVYIALGAWLSNGDPGDVTTVLNPPSR